MQYLDLEELAELEEDGAGVGERLLILDTSLRTNIRERTGSVKIDGK